MENDESTSTTGAPHKDTPEVVPSGGRTPISDPSANTASSKHSTGARDTARGKSDQRQGDTAPYGAVTQGQQRQQQRQQQWENDLEAHSLDEDASEGEV